MFYYVNMKDELVNEALLKSAAAIFVLNRMTAQQLASGIMNMYDYIVDNDDINLFLKDYPIKERILWNALYVLYQNKVWSIIDVDKTTIDDLSISGKTKVTPDFRRNLRRYIKQSRNKNLDIQASAPEFLTSIYDDVNDVYYILTLNRTASAVKAVLQLADKKLISNMFDKISGFQTEGLDDIDESIMKSLSLSDIKQIVDKCYNWIKNHKDAIADFAEQIITLCELIKSSKLSARDKFLILAALAYLLTPIDLIPDATIGGFADDAAVMWATLEILKTHITPELKDKVKNIMSSLFKRKNESLISFRDHLIESLK